MTDERGREPASGGSARERAVVGVISDTHGLLREEAVEALAGVGSIVHAGDVDSPEILERLERIAPVKAVRGNVDHGSWAAQLPTTRVVEEGGRQLYVLHDPDDLDLDPAAAGFDVVIHGHTHRTRNERIGGVLYLNPGSAGPQRPGRSASVAYLYVDVDPPKAEIVELDF